MRDNEKIKDLIKEFEEVNIDSIDFYNQVKSGYYKRDYSEAAINQVKLDFIEKKINILQETLIYLIKKSESKGNINKKL